MLFSDDEDVPTGGTEGHKPQLSGRSDKLAKALAELRKITRQETALRARIDDLTRPYKLPTGRRL